MRDPFAGHVLISDEEMPEPIPDFRYLALSSRPEATKVRANVLSWLNHFPAQAASSLLDSFSSDDNAAHRSAFFELAVHELLIRGGTEILEVEPELGGKGKKPDFLCRSSTGEEFVVECTDTQGRSKEETSRQKLLDSVVAAINELTSETHAIWLEYNELPRAPIKKEALQKPVAQWLANLSPSDGPDSLRLKLEFSGFILRIRPIPVTKPQTRIVGMLGASGMRENTQPDAIRRNLKKKCNKYGDLGVPFIVAINVPWHMKPGNQLVDVLYGNPAIRFDPRDPENTVEEVRQLDGFWRNKNGVANQRLTGIIVANDLAPWSVAHRKLWYLENPWPRRPCVTPLPALPTIAVVDNRIVDQEGVDARKIYGLDADWPD